jgi:hypothetical protein
MISPKALRHFVCRVLLGWVAKKWWGLLEDIEHYSLSTGF